MEPADIADLIRETPDGLSLQLKQGKFTALSGIYSTAARKLHIRFNYNRSFSGKKPYPDPGSWTTTLRPDYTLTFWPAGIPEPEAEKQELIVHIHFDAKYKVDNLADLLQTKSARELDEEKTSHRRGLYKNADLLKMHAYRDAIRRTGTPSRVALIFCIPATSRSVGAGFMKSSRDWGHSRCALPKQTAASAS